MLTVIPFRVPDRVPTSGCKRPESADSKLFTVKFAEVAPAGIVTVEGNPSCERSRLVESDTTRPPAGAGPFNVTVPVLDPKRLSVEGVRLIPLKMAGVTERLTVTGEQEPKSA